MATHMPTTENTPIAIRIAVEDSTKKLKLPLKDLSADKLIPKLRHVLQVEEAQEVVFERYSDSVAGYVTLDPANPAVFKTLVRAAKAKLKLRLRASVSPPHEDQETPENKDKDEAPEKSECNLSDALTGTCTAGAPTTIVPVRGSTAFDQRSVGPGIFQFRNPALTEKKLQSCETGEAPVPQSFAVSNKDFFADLAAHGREHELALRTKEVSRPSTWSVYCNVCDKSMDNVHFHCSVCDDGDYDLCQSCVDGGKLCPGEGHWLIKRSIVSGKIVASTTETISPRARMQPTPVPDASVEVDKIENVPAERDMPGAFTDDTRTLNDEPEGGFRTCNNCIIGLPDHEFVTCAVCDDFDLCRRCYVSNKHGHHPAHHFTSAVSNAKLSVIEKALLLPGRNVLHNAICDGCDKNIRGIRHKCFSCPDFDYCNDCVKNARLNHPRHRFAQIYEPTAIARPGSVSVTHHGVYCDGPLCKNEPCQSYIQGVRYKCVVCHDTDFCASCEALPGNTHNKTHPLVKFKTPVNNVTVSTQNETKDGKVKNLGDKSLVAIPAPRLTANVTTPVKTVADIKPSQKVAEQVKPETKATIPVYHGTVNKSSDIAPLEAHFVKDLVVDGTVVAPNARFTQVWTMVNPGPRAWPAGCSVRFTGGDKMYNVDNTRPLSVSDINEATESNVVGREVLPGEEVAFKVLLKAPLREGKLISYWRVKTCEGTAFGHKLWCEINVEKVAVDVTKETGTSSDMVDASTQPQCLEQTKVAEYWAGYQSRMAAIRLANAQRQAALQRAQEYQLSSRQGALQAQLDVAATYQAQADWRRQMEEFVRRTNTSNMLQPAASDDGSKADMTVKADVVPSTVVIESVSQEKEEDEEKELKDSQMIFPTLERESPCSSTYESFGSSTAGTGKAAFVEDEQTGLKVADASLARGSSSEVEAASPMQGANDEEEDEAFEDISELDVLSADGDEASDEDGFMTDEEYDILDASDQETVASK